MYKPPTCGGGNPGCLEWLGLPRWHTAMRLDWMPVEESQRSICVILLKRYENTPAISMYAFAKSMPLCSWTRPIHHGCISHTPPICVKHCTPHICMTYFAVMYQRQGLTASRKEDGSVNPRQVCACCGPPFYVSVPEGLSILTSCCSQWSEKQPPLMHFNNDTMTWSSVACLWSM